MDLAPKWLCSLPWRVCVTLRSAHKPAAASSAFINNKHAKSAGNRPNLYTHNLVRGRRACGWLVGLWLVAVGWSCICLYCAPMLACVCAYATCVPCAAHIAMLILFCACVHRAAAAAAAQRMFKQQLAAHWKRLPFVSPLNPATLNCMSTLPWWEGVSRGMSGGDAPRVEP